MSVQHAYVEPEFEVDFEVEAVLRLARRTTLADRCTSKAVPAASLGQIFECMLYSGTEVMGSLAGIAEDVVVRFKE